MRLGVLALTFVVSGPAHAQSVYEGSIEGTVRDQTGAMIVGAAVAARQLETSASFHATTDGSGTFRFIVVPAGLYALSVEHAGFVTFIQRDILVTVGARVSVAVVLRLQSREELVSVTVGTQVLEPTRTSPSSVVDQRSIASLPLQGRNYLNFALLTPGVATTGAATFSVAGLAGMISLLVDGADLNGFDAQPVGSLAANRYLFSQESVQEFQVKRGPYSAEFGRAGTAVINVITKTGTNEAHGSGFWYYRDRDLNAIGAMEKMKGEPKEPYHSNQFGVTLGGPALRDRLFFYGSYDGQRRAERSQTVLNLPADFSPSKDLVVAGFQQQALDYLRARSAPYPAQFEQDVVLAKLDWRAGPDHRLHGSWNRHRFNFSNSAVMGPQQSFEHTGTAGQVADTFSLALTSVLNPRSFNVVRFNYVGNHNPRTPNSYLPEAIVSEQQQVLLVGRIPNLPVDNGVWRTELSDTASLNRGDHILKLGADMMLERARFFSALNFFGSYQFSSLEKFGRSLDGQRGMADRYIQAFSASGTPPIDVHPDSIEPAAFIQDTWRIHPTVTLDLGLRYETQLMSRSTVRNPSPALDAAGVDTTFIPSDTNNVAPRIGFAWNPRRMQRLVVRGGYGRYFPRFLPATAARAFFQNGITTQTRTFTGSDVPAYPNTKCGPPDPSGAPPACAAPVGGVDTIMSVPRSYRQSVVQQSSLGVEYSPATDVAVSFTYLRVKGDSLMHWRDINLFEPGASRIAVAGTDTLLTYRGYPGATVRPISGFDRILLLDSCAQSTYHGITFEANKRFSHGFQLAGSYAFSKAIDDKPTQGDLNPGPGDGGLLMDSLAPELDRAVGANTDRHSVVLSGVWVVDFARHLAHPARAILNGWEVSGVLSGHSGNLYSGMVNSDLNGDGNRATDRAPGLARNTFSMPAIVLLDTRLTRKVPLTNSVAMHVSWDTFNVFNRVNVSTVKTTQYSVERSVKCGAAGTPCLVPQADFGTTTAVGIPRMMQLSVRLIF